GRNRGARGQVARYNRVEAAQGADGEIEAFGVEARREGTLAGAGGLAGREPGGKEQSQKLAALQHGAAGLPTGGGEAAGIGDEKPMEEIRISHPPVPGRFFEVRRGAVSKAVPPSTRVED